VSLTKEQFSRLAKVALQVAKERGQSFYGWVNPPQIESGKLTHDSGKGPQKISPEESLAIYKRKLDGVYGERFITSLGTIAALIANGYSVRLVQFYKEVGLPFDAEGWLVVIIETMPIFHVSPGDLRLEQVADLVEVLDDNQAPDVCHKGTDKPGEFAALLQGSLSPELDLVKIAQENSGNF